MPQRPTLMSTRGMVATEHYLSAEAGLRILHGGGNAFDAAVAATLVEGVVNPHMHTFGGELSALVYVAAERKVFAVNGDTVAPRAATIEWFRAHGIDLIPDAGVLAAGPPATPHALLTTLSRFGTRSFAEVVTPALELAEDGFPLHPALRGPAPANPLGDFSLAGSAELFRTQWPTSAAIYLPGGSVPEVGERIRNTDLARTFRRLIDAEDRASRHGRRDGIAAAIDAFYRGEIADLIAAHAAAHGGLLALEDLHDFGSEIEPTVSLDYRGLTVHKCGPWSQGPVFLQQLALLAGFDLKSLGHGTATTFTSSRRRRSSPSPTASSSTAILASSTCRSPSCCRNDTRRRAAPSSIPAALLSSSAPAIRATAPRCSTARRSSPRATGDAAPSTSRRSTARATWLRSRRAARGFRPRP